MLCANVMRIGVMGGTSTSVGISLKHEKQGHVEGGRLD